MCRADFGILSTSLIAAVVLAGSPSASAQGETGFLRGTGKTDVAFSYSFDSYRHFWVGTQRVTDPGVGRVTREAANVYFAYGVDATTDFIATASYLDVESDGIASVSNRDEKQIQDSTVGFKHKANEWRLGPGALTLFAAPSAKIPLAHYESDAITAIGDGQIDYRGRAILQYTVDSGLFAAVESGFDYRTESPSNEIPLNITLGIPVTSHVTITPFYSLVKSSGNKDIGQVPFPAVQEEFRRWGVSAYIRVNEQIGLTVGWKDTLDGRNTGDVTGYWFGFVIRF